MVSRMDSEPVDLGVLPYGGSSQWRSSVTPGFITFGKEPQNLAFFLITCWGYFSRAGMAQSYPLAL